MPDYPSDSKEGLAEAEHRIAACKKSHSPELHLYNLGLFELPDSVQELNWLQTLNAASNSFRSLPSWIGKLTNLRRFYLHGNPLQRLPPAICELRNLVDLTLDSALPEAADP